MMTEANKANRALELFAALRKSIDNEVNAKKSGAHLDLNNGNNKFNKDSDSIKMEKSNITHCSTEVEESNTKLITSSNIAQESLSSLQIRLPSNQTNEYKRSCEAAKLANEQLTQCIADAQKQIKELQSENSALKEKWQTCTKELQQEKLQIAECKEEWQNQVSLLQRHKKELSKRLYETECLLKKTMQELEEHKNNDKSSVIDINNINTSEEKEYDYKNKDKAKVTIRKADEPTKLLVIGEGSNNVTTLQMCIANLKEQLSHLSEQYNHLLNVQLDAALGNTSNEEECATNTTYESMKKENKRNNNNNNNNVHFINEEVKKLFVVLRGALRIQVEERQKERKRINALLYKLESKLASLEEEF